MNPSFRPHPELPGQDKGVNGGLLTTSLLILVTGSILVAGCSGPTNRTIIDPGTPDPGLLEDMQYKPTDLPLNTSPMVPEGIVLRNLTVGTLKDGSLLFRGLVTNKRDSPIPGYIIVYIEVLDSDTGTSTMSHPLVSPWNIHEGASFQYFLRDNRTGQ